MGEIVSLEEPAAARARPDRAHSARAARLLWPSVAIALLLGATSCGAAASSGTHSAARPTPTPSTVPESSVSTTGPGGPDLSLFPDQATPIDQAPTNLQSVWRSLGPIAVIPGKNIFDHMPPVPRVVNLTAGAVSDTDAQAWGLSLYREGALSIFAEAHSDANLLGAFQADAATNADVISTLVTGGTVDDPPCDQYPTQLTLRPVSQADRDFFTAAHKAFGQPTYIFTATFTATGVCATTATLNGKTTTLFSFDNRVVAFAPGEPRGIGPLGTMFYLDATGSCTESGAPTDVCG